MTALAATVAGLTAGSTTIADRTAKLADRLTISQSWGAEVTQSGSVAASAHETWNGSLGAVASTSFGFIASWNGTLPVPSVTCS